jgi:hypothetical protein
MGARAYHALRVRAYRRLQTKSRGLYSRALNILSPARTLTVTACGAFFLTALLSGIWKWRAMLTRPDHRAPYYVDTAHRAALLYSFACLVLERFVELSPFDETINLVAAAFPILFFATAVVTYLSLGWKNRTENQFTERTFATTTGMVLLIFAEVGGFLVLFGGFVASRFGGR